MPEVIAEIKKIGKHILTTSMLREVGAAVASPNVQGGECNLPL